MATSSGRSSAGDYRPGLGSAPEKRRARVTEHADVAIVGAGVIGCSVAFHLARLGRTGGVLLIEKESLPGSGSTSKANGGIRAQFTTEINVAMSLASMAILDAL